MIGCRPLRGLDYFLGDLIQGLTPQAGVPSRASRLGWKSLCRRALCALTRSLKGIAHGY